MPIQQQKIYSLRLLYFFLLMLLSWEVHAQQPSSPDSTKSQQAPAKGIRGYIKALARDNRAYRQRQHQTPPLSDEAISAYWRSIFYTERSPGVNDSLKPKPPRGQRVRKYIRSIFITERQPGVNDSAQSKPSARESVKNYINPPGKSSTKWTKEALRQQPQPTVGIFVYPLSLFTANVEAGVELKLGFRTSIRVVGAYGQAEASQSYIVTDMNRGFLEAHFRYYPLRYAMKNVYFMGYAYANTMRYTMNMDVLGDRDFRGMGTVAGTIDFYDMKGIAKAYELRQNTQWKDYPVLSGSGAALGFGIAIGFHLKVSQRLVIDCYAGFGPQLGRLRGEASDWLTDKHPLPSMFGSGMAPQLGLAIGGLFFGRSNKPAKQ
jgi:hypothetical protein